MPDESDARDGAHELDEPTANTASADAVAEQVDEEHEPDDPSPEPTTPDSDPEPRFEHHEGDDEPAAVSDDDAAPTPNGDGGQNPHDDVILDRDEHGAAFARVHGAADTMLDVVEPNASEEHAETSTGTLTVTKEITGEDAPSDDVEFRFMMFCLRAGWGDDPPLFFSLGGSDSQVFEIPIDEGRDAAHCEVTEIDREPHVPIRLISIDGGPPSRAHSEVNPFEFAGVVARVRVTPRPDGHSVTFTNVFPVTGTLVISKQVTGKDIPPGDVYFDFMLSCLGSGWGDRPLVFSRAHGESLPLVVPIDEGTDATHCEVTEIDGQPRADATLLSIDGGPRVRAGSQTNVLGINGVVARVQITPRPDGHSVTFINVFGDTSPPSTPVSSTAVSRTPTHSPSEPLARTGVGVLPLALVGATALAVGGLMVRFSGPVAVGRQTSGGADRYAPAPRRRRWIRDRARARMASRDRRIDLTG